MGTTAQSRMLLIMRTSLAFNFLCQRNEIGMMTPLKQVRERMRMGKTWITMGS
ncbi:hypothetical protein CVT26_004459 [Gymnopilus dilepis]|uniref:Uncharacterized protein n=1 Tax=Gymnopilus dilepis TaxID=231916 RepID=A0A409XBT8_9AGAR|nr:hypothetical protein CVT26_004459 [Gymnopilus dilepis]